MHKVGFKTVRLGLETSDALAQVHTGGKATNEGFQRAVENLRMAGFQPEEITVYLLMGLPGQSLEEVVDSVSFVHAHGVRVQIALYSVIPGTTEWQRAVEGWGFDPHADPLLHNDSIYPFPWSEATWEAFEAVKAKALAGNRALSAGD